MVMNDYNYLEVYLFEKNERTPAYLMSFPKRYGIRQLEASNQRLLIKPTKDIPMVEELLLQSLFKGKFFLCIDKIHPCANFKMNQRDGPKSYICGMVGMDQYLYAE
jgi:hypothetical protein